MTATATTTRYTVRPAQDRQGWEVLDHDGTVVDTATSRAEARARRAELAAGTEAPEVAEGGPVTTFTDPQGEDLPEDVEVVVPSVEEEATRAEADRQAAELAAEHAAVDNDNAAQAAMDAERAVPATRTKAAKHQRVSLARVQVGDRLMTNLTTEGNGIVYAAPHRFSDGQVRTVAEVTTRKAGDGEMPGKLYTLVFEDGTVSEERYGTTSHYTAEAFTGGQVTPEEPPAAPEPTPAPEKAPKKAPAPKIATTASRASKLGQGSRLVLRDLGVVTVDQVSKTGDGKLEVAYTTAGGDAGVREMWGSTNVRLAADA